MTAGAAAGRVRELIQDTETPLRFSEGRVYRALRDGLAALWRARPDARYFGTRPLKFSFPAIPETGDFPTGVGATPSLEAAAAAELSLPEERWSEAVVYYALHKLYLADSADTQNAALSDRYLKLFTEAARL